MLQDAHRNDRKRFVVHADEKLTALIELESMIRENPIFACYLCTSLFKCRTACDMSFVFVFPNPRTKPRRGVVPK